MPRPKKIPSLRRHKPSNRAVVTIDGKDVYCGPWNAPESRAEYERLIREWLQRGSPLRPSCRPSTDITISELVNLYWRFAHAHYQRDGEPSREISNIREALKPFERLYGHTLAIEFGPVAFKTLRAELLEQDLCISTIRHRLSKLLRLFRWAVENELLPGDAYHRLKAVAPLRPGRDGVRAPTKVKPVPDEHVDAVLPYLPPTVRAMVDLQRLTGMRPGEVVSMTMGQIERAGELWIYKPEKHKNAAIGKEREIILGPKAQNVLRRWLKADPDAPLFSPAESVESRNKERREKRNPETPRGPWAVARVRKENPKRPPRAWYDKNAYGQAVRRACLKAGVPVWSPNRLRHSVATLVRQKFGLEAAQVVLGHSKADVTQVYAERNRELARDVMREIG